MFASRLTLLLAAAAALGPLVLAASVSNAQLLRLRDSLGDTNGTASCSPDCLKMIGATGCAGSDDKCICGQDFRFQTSFFKCIFDKCSIDLAADVFGTYSSGCNDAIGTADAPVSDASKTSSAAPLPSGTPAAAFSLPSCGAGCIAKGNFTACGTSLTPDCVCKAQDPSPFIKCALDSCDAGGTANTINTFAINCGEFSAQTPANQLLFPFSNFAAAASASSASAAASTSSHKNGAPALVVSSMLLAAGLLVFGVAHL